MPISKLILVRKLGLLKIKASTFPARIGVFPFEKYSFFNDSAFFSKATISSTGLLSEKKRNH